MGDVVTEAKALESAHTANKQIADSTKSTTEEQVHWVRHKEMKLRREPRTCHWCGDRKGPHPWKQCPARGKTYSKCGINDHFGSVCLANGQPQQRRGPPSPTDAREAPITNPATGETVEDVMKLYTTSNSARTNPQILHSTLMTTKSNATL